MNDDKIKNPSTNAVARMAVTLKPIEEPASPIPNIVLASCLHGEHRRDHGPNTFAAALVRAGLVSRYSCKCEWCELGRRVPGIGCDPEEQHQPEDSMRFWLRVVRDDIGRTILGQRCGRPLSHVRDDIDRLLARWEPESSMTCHAQRQRMSVAGAMPLCGLRHALYFPRAPGQSGWQRSDDQGLAC